MSESRRKREQREALAASQKREQQPAEQEVVLTQQISQRTYGPIPDPATLAAYNAVMPGLGEQIVQAWVSETEHRRSIEKTEVAHAIKMNEKQISIVRAGQLCGTVVSLAALAASVWIVSLSKENAQWILAAVLGVAGISGLVKANLEPFFNREPKRPSEPAPAQPKPNAPQ